MNVVWRGNRQAIRSRWLVRGMVSVCWLALCLAGQPAHAQGILTGAIATAPADDEEFVLEDLSLVPMLAGWDGSMPAAPAARSGDGTAFKTPPSASAATSFAGDRSRGAVFGTPVSEQEAGTHLGAPRELLVLAETPALIPVQYVPPMRRRELDDILPNEGMLYTSIQLSLPGPQRLFRLESEAEIHERIRQEARQQRTPYAIEFPEEFRFETREKIFHPRRWPLSTEVVEPQYVWHGRLFFEQLNSERYGWDMGILQPVLSTGRFYADVLTLPYHVAEDPCRHGDTNAGKCLPGDPVPLLLYPPHWSLTGLGAEAAVVTLLVFALP